MAYKLDIAFNGTKDSHGVRAFVMEQAAKLNRFHDLIEECQVIVFGPSAGQRGDHYRVWVAVTLEAMNLLVKDDQSTQSGGDDVYEAVRNAFDRTITELNAYTGRLL